MCLAYRTLACTTVEDRLTGQVRVVVGGGMTTWPGSPHSVNALYYDPLEGTVLDYTTGLDDIETRTLRIIGEAPAASR